MKTALISTLLLLATTKAIATASTSTVTNYTEPSSLAVWLPIVISALSFIATVALTFAAYQQAMAAKCQADAAIQQANAAKAQVAAALLERRGQVYAESWNLIKAATNNTEELDEALLRKFQSHTLLHSRVVFGKEMNDFLTKVKSHAWKAARGEPTDFFNSYKTFDRLDELFDSAMKSIEPVGAE